MLLLVAAAMVCWGVWYPITGAEADRSTQSSDESQLGVRFVDRSRWLQPGSPGEGWIQSSDLTEETVEAPSSLAKAATTKTVSDVIRVATLPAPAKTVRQPWTTSERWTIDARTATSSANSSLSSPAIPKRPLPSAGLPKPIASATASSARGPFVAVPLPLSLDRIVPPAASPSPAVSKLPAMPRMIVPNLPRDSALPIRTPATRVEPLPPAPLPVAVERGTPRVSQPNDISQQNGTSEPDALAGPTWSSWPKKSTVPARLPTSNAVLRSPPVSPALLRFPSVVDDSKQMHTTVSRQGVVATPVEMTLPPTRLGPFEVLDHTDELAVVLRRSKLLRTQVDVYRTAV
ncbi:MAG: hypothetical protein HQ581_26350, partial [Planctomycetes bacterium]|nr:hypothetical protein [Planctomycetota bacterium]